MKIPYRTQRALNRVGTVFLIFLVLAILGWICWVTWLSRFVVYGREGKVTLDFELSQEIQGVLATPPEPKGEVPIFFNEGADAVELTKELTQLSGYYISYKDLSTDLAGVKEDLNLVPPGTPVMIELKGGYGSFYYNSSLPDSIGSASVDTAAVDELISSMKTKGYYLIARVSAFQDYNFGLNHVSSGLPLVGLPYLWLDEEGCYWLKPSDPITLNWVTAVVNELKEMGFHEVMLANFRFPNSEKYSYKDDKEEALKTAAQTLMTSCSSEGFTLSFGVATTTFPMPEGRCRMYLDSVEAKDVQTRAGQATVGDPVTQIVFLGSTNDTRYDEYSVLRPISLAEVLEAQKADIAANEPATTPTEGTAPAEG